MKGIKFVVLNEISLEAKEKLKRLEDKRKVKLEKLIADYRETVGSSNRKEKENERKIDI